MREKPIRRIALIYTDKGFSGKNTDRPDLQRLITDIKFGKIDKVIVYKLDRISRNITDFYKLYEIMEQNKCGFLSASEAFETSSAMGKVMMGILAILNKWNEKAFKSELKIIIITELLKLVAGLEVQHHTDIKTAETVKTIQLLFL